jgi:hypothetical protein
MLKQLSKTEIAIELGQSLFQYKVKSVSEGMGKTERAVKKSTNAKLGKKVLKGRLKGADIYTLTLEERKTCPPTCAHWLTCFGNNMHLATRYTYDEALIVQIEQDIEFYNSKNKPFLVRLHVLGDFADMLYVMFWERMLATYEHLNVYGYTARQLGTPIGDKLNSMRSIRFMVRISGDTSTLKNTALSYDDLASHKQLKTGQAFLCPTQIANKGDTKLAKKDQETLTDSCATCTLCWTIDKNVVFLTH